MDAVNRALALLRAESTNPWTPALAVATLVSAGIVLGRVRYRGG